MNAEKIRKDFPILKRKVHGKRLVYLDNAATAQKPVQVIEALSDFYSLHNANVHRAVHTLSQEATERYDTARERVAGFIGAGHDEIVFVRNATEAINIVLYAWARHNLRQGDEIVATVMEHHSNIVPWQSLQEKGVKLEFVDINEDGTLRMEDYERLVTRKTKLVTVAHASNVLGTINPVKDIAKLAHDAGARCLVDGAQSVPHMPVDVGNIGCDFLVFSGHKMLAPTGTGVLWGRKELLDSMGPFMLGSDIIKEVSLEKTTFREAPWKFEPGTPDFAGAVALGAAVEYLQKLGMRNVRKHEQSLTAYALRRLQEVGGMTMYGPRSAEQKGGVISFNLGDIHSHDLSTILDEAGIAVRSGHHCAMPLMKRLGIDAAARASFYIYNTKEEIETLARALEKAKKVFGV
ncbi:MAG: cysteine desulfurase [Candidatus Aenigmarchaeota archaeon]|nr:cysteine desulfurase [Candidatus Aenigmarchaeota archaeon]